MKRTLIREGGIYLDHRQDAFRRVVGIVQGRVFYSTGGDRNYSCKLRTFQRWARFCAGGEFRLSA